MQHDFQILLVLWGEEFDGSELSSIEDELWDFFDLILCNLLKQIGQKMTFLDKQLSRIANFQPYFLGYHVTFITYRNSTPSKLSYG